MPEAVTQRLRLLEPVAIGPLRLRNRVAMAPMTREMSPGGIIGADAAAYYARRAAGGVALVIGEGASVAPEGAFGARVPRFHGEDALAGWSRVARAVKTQGAAFVPQLWHVGAASPRMVGMAESLPDVERLSPSGLAGPGVANGREMRERDIADTLAAFAAAGAAARAIGCDGVEIHAAHGYLPDQFLWEPTNRRGDRWGGDLSGRLRFLVELVRAVRAATAPDFPVFVRLSQWKQLDYRAQIAADPHTLAAIVEPLAAAGVDVFHCSARRFSEPAFSPDPRPLSAWVRRLSGKPTIAVGSVTLATDFKAPGGRDQAAPAREHIERLEAGLARGDFDLIAIGRALLANPDWVAKVAAGREDTLRGYERGMLARLD